MLLGQVLAKPEMGIDNNFHATNEKAQHALRRAQFFSFGLGWG